MIRNENEVISVKSNLKAYVPEDIQSIDVDVCGNGCGAFLGLCYGYTCYFFCNRRRIHDR